MRVDESFTCDSLENSILHSQTWHKLDKSIHSKTLNEFVLLDNCPMQKPMCLIGGLSWSQRHFLKSEILVKTAI